jgi:predicted ferric reductase
VLGVTALLAAYLHLDNTHAHSQLAANVGHWAFYLSLAVALYSIVFMSGWLVDRFRSVAKVKHCLEHVLHHQVSLWLHRLNLIAVVLIAVHVHVIAQLRQHLVFMIVFDLYTVATLGVYAWKKWIAPDSYLTGLVTENRALNGSTRQVRITLDSRSADIRPGDFFFIRFEGPGIPREWHPFSLTDDSQGVVVFTIRQLGDYTRTVPQIPIGTTARLDGPFGRFDGIIRESGAGRPLVLIGMGAGVAPLLSLAAGYLRNRKISLLWSIHSPNDNYYADLIDNYRNSSDGSFDALTRVGRFTRDALQSQLSEEQIGNAIYFIVGPNAGVLSTQRTLKRLGVSTGRIHHERLTM